MDVVFGRLWILFWVCLGAALAAAEPGGSCTVVWISVDGLRGDYLDRGRYPFFARIEAEGATTRQLVPAFPSITFSSHASMATGVGVDRHGIIGNTVFDPVAGCLHKFPSDPGLLLAEPIWLTAARQGVPVLVYDWPLSQGQRGPVTAALFRERFDPSLSDEARLQGLMEAWKNYAGAVPLRLIMGYVVGPDAVGHQRGPDDPEVAEKMGEVDRVLGEFFEAALSHWRRRARPGDTFRFLVTSDHGMARVRSLANLERILGGPIPPDVFVATNGPVGTVHLDRVTDAVRRRQLLERYESRLSGRDYLTVYRRDQIPSRWAFAHPSRTGDLVAVLRPGWTFSRQFPRETYVVEEAGGPLGMHGYDPLEVPEMQGWMGLWESGAGPRNLGAVDSLRLHPTVARWLGIRPAPDAVAPPIE